MGRHLTGDCELDCQQACAYPGKFSECDQGSLQPHDLDAPEVEPVDSAAPPATTGGVDDDAGNSERQARLEPIPLYPWQVDVLRSLRGRLSALEDRQRLPCRFPFAACDFSEGVVPRQVDVP